MWTTGVANMQRRVGHARQSTNPCHEQENRKAGVNSSYRQLTLSRPFTSAIRYDPCQKHSSTAFLLRPWSTKELTPAFLQEAAGRVGAPGSRNGCWREDAPAAVSPTLPLQRTVSRRSASPSRSLGAPTRCRTNQHAFIGTTARRCSCAERGRGPRARLRARRAVAPRINLGAPRRRSAPTSTPSARARNPRSASSFRSRRSRNERESWRLDRAASSPLSMSDRDALLTRAVTWCIERYYQPGQPRQ